MSIYSRRLKINIFANIAVFSGLATLLIGFVMISTTQSDLFHYEVSRGHLVLSFIEDYLGEYFLQDGFKDHIDIEKELCRILDRSSVQSILIVDKNDKIISAYGTGFDAENDHLLSAKQSMTTKEDAVIFKPPFWGVLGKQPRNLVISAPLFLNERVVAGASVVLSLDEFSLSLQKQRKVLLIYFFINTIIFTVVGFYRLSEVIVRPVHKLVKMAEEYQDNDELFFCDKEGNEFRKLSKALNRMLKRISDDKKKLESTVMCLKKTNSDLKLAQADIIRAEKLASVGRLSAGIAHEIGNPIGIVLGYLELLKQGNNDKDQKEYILRSENEISRINLILRNLLDFSRDSASVSETVYVHDIINNMVDILKVQPLMADINIKQMLLAEKDTIIADPGQLKQIFMNLMINAADAINSKKNKDGEIIIKTVILDSDTDTGGHKPVLRIEFIDNGTGIPMENLKNIYDPFYTTKEPGKGTGLGLSVTFMIVKRFNGNIDARSKDGSGTTMILDFPFFPEPVSAQSLRLPVLQSRQTGFRPNEDLTS